MKVLRILTCLLLALSLAPGSQAEAQARDPWEKQPTCVFGMPYTGHAVQQDGNGLLQAVLREVYEPEDIVFEHRNIPYSRVRDALANDTIHCSMTIRERTLGGTLGRSVLTFYDLSAAALLDTPWQGVESLRETRAAYQHGYDIEEFIPVPFTVQMLYDLSTAFHMLDTGLIRYVLDDARLLREAMRESNLPSHLFAIHPIRTFAVVPTFARTPEGDRFRAVYDRRMRELKRSGRLAEIMRAHDVPKQRIEQIMKAD